MTRKTRAHTQEAWQNLFSVASRIKAMKPWEWMEEVDIFGVRDPESGQLGFVSVMGMLGEHLAITVYQEAEGLYAFWAIQELGAAGNPEAILNVPQIQLSFEDADILTDEDRQIIREMGFKFQGRQAWPQFRSYKAGFFPWYLTAEEVRLLTIALEQTLALAPRIKEDRSILSPDIHDDTKILVRATDNNGQWQDQVLTISPPEFDPIEIIMDMELLELVKKNPRVGNTLEIDFFMFPSPVQESTEERPFYPFLLLVAEADSGMVIGSEMLSPQPNMATMWGKLPLELLRIFQQHEIIPYDIHVSNPMLASLLQTLTDELGYSVQLNDTLPMLDKARAAIMDRFNE